MTNEIYCHVRSAPTEGGDDQTCQTFDLTQVQAEHSETIKGIAEDAEDVVENPIDLPDVGPETLKYVVDYLREYSNQSQDDRKEIKDDPKTLEPELQKRWFELLNFDKTEEMTSELLFKIINAANYLGVDSLLHVGCQTTADLIKGKKPEEIREIFGLPDDVSPDEWKAFREEHGLEEIEKVIEEDE